MFVSRISADVLSLSFQQRVVSMGNLTGNEELFAINCSMVRSEVGSVLLSGDKRMDLWSPFH